MCEVSFVGRVLSQHGIVDGDASKIVESVKSEFNYVNTQLRALLEAAKDTVNKKKSAVEEARLAQWLSFKEQQLVEGAKENLSKALKELDNYLAAHSFLVYPAKASIADYSLFWNLRGHITEKMATQFPSLCRWFDAVQHEAAVATALGKDYIKKSFVFPDVFTSFQSGAPKPQPAAQPAKGAAKAPVAPAKKNDKSNKAGDKKPAAKKPKQDAKATPASTQPEITKLDIRVGKVVKCWKHESADKLYCEEIDVGEDAPRQIASGLVEYYPSSSDIEGRLVLVLCNLKPRNLAGFKSNGMVLCASSEGKGKVELVDPPSGSKVGERVTFSDIEGGPYTPLAPNQVAKKKVFEACAPNLKTNENCQAYWMDESKKPHLFTTSEGVCRVPTISKGTVS
uniref:tRNA-binding domain-containing protein n=1 Tax=Mucochytrium quahogii TaxID=96639 RepID=A0A7S2RCB4_9STRA|mmetsp:Transcript_472/g.637  ORF Transcript_472/g.637 Transcript_472/m.637 type:complete len:396 (+) Transcript_472:94-1281(+)